MHRHSPTITIKLPDTPAIREALMHLGGRAVDDDAWFWEDASEAAALRRADVVPLRGRGREPESPLGPEQCAERAEAYRTINEAILAALGVVA